MATTVYYCASSLDGYIARPDDSLDWLLGYEGSFEHEAAEPDPLSEGGAYEGFYAGVRALVMGSTTYEWILTTSTSPAAASGRTGASRAGC